MTSSGTGLDEGISNPASAALAYDVFLSFHGKDTRYKFTSHLYSKLRESGIRVYKDNEELHIGEEIAPGLCQGIEQSKIAIPILSEGYATSSWCLDELVLIMKRMREGSLNVKPIFYHVKPSQVRKQTGSYKKAFEFHRKKHCQKTISEWKGALTEVAKVKGWESDPKTEEGKLVQEITMKVWDELKKVHLFINEDLVGHEDHAEEILSKLDAKRNRLWVLGIYGMAGIGKTALAKVIYNHFLPQFKSCSFVADIRENYATKGIQFLLKKLMLDILNKELTDNVDVDEGFQIIRERFPNRKVLILLDDVDKSFQVDGLIGRPAWCASGSIVIVTTRNKHIFDEVDVDWTYELPVMHHHHGRQLFIKRAFQHGKPSEDYEELIEEAVKISGGLPLWLEVIGSSLRNKSKEVWEFTLEKLKKVPPEDVKERLNISFNALDKRQQQILLDIACFFIGVDHRMAIHFWDGLELYPKQAINDLQQNCLIKIGTDNLIWMHDQIRDFCTEYTKKDHIGEPEKQRVLWDQEVAKRILKGKMVAKSVQGLFLQFDMQSQSLCTAENLSKLPKLKFLQVKGHDISQVISLFGRGLRTIARLFNLLRWNPLALSELRWLYWPHFPPIYDLNIFSLRNLVFLDLSKSSISDGWDRWSHIKIAERLRVLNLSGCKKLTKTPNFSKNPLLEQLILERCTSLIEIDSSIRMLKCLLIINLRGCRRLRKLPTQFGDMESLVELILDDTSLSKFPKSIGDLEHLSLLSLRNCSSILALPKSITGLQSLVQLDLSYSGIVELPVSIGKMKNLKVLNMDGCNIREFPPSIGMLERLKEISADRCHRLESIPNLPHSLSRLTVRSEARMKRIPDFSNLTSLEHLIAFFVNVPCDQPEMEIIWNIGKLSRLVDVKVMFPHIQILHGDLGEHSNLEKLVLQNCSSLRSIPKLSSNLRTLRVNYCRLLKSLSNLSHLKRLRDLHIEHTPIDKVEGLQMLENLRELVFDNCGIRRLPDMSIMKKLKILEVKSCPRLVEIQGRLLESLEGLDLFDCISLKKMPDIPNKETMKRFNIVNCGKFSSTKDEDPTTIEHKQAADDFMKTYQKENAIRDLLNEKLLESISDIPLIFFFLLVSTLSTPKLLGLEPHRLSWLGIFLFSIILFILNGSHSMILEVMSCLRLVGIQGSSLESLEELDLFDCISMEKMPDILNKETKIVNWGKFSSAEDEDPTTSELKQAIDDFMNIFQEEDDADQNLSLKYLFERKPVVVSITLLLPVLAVLAPKFLGLDPHRLSWLGIYLIICLMKSAHTGY